MHASANCNLSKSAVGPANNLENDDNKWANLTPIWACSGAKLDVHVIQSANNLSWSLANAWCAAMVLANVSSSLRESINGGSSSGSRLPSLVRPNGHRRGLCMNGLTTRSSGVGNNSLGRANRLVGDGVVWR